MTLTVQDVRVFVPAKDFSQSLTFYQAMGWKIDWLADAKDLAILSLGSHRFYLQDYYKKAWANNFMIYLDVDDATAWHSHASAVIATGNHGAARIKPPQQQAYGALVTFVWDPSGVLLHFAQGLNDD